MSFLSELKRRNVIRVAVLYVVSAWLILQVVDVVAPILALPEWFARGVLLVLALAFVPTLVFSWVYELTPEGLKRESEVVRSESMTAETARKLDIAVIALLVLTLGVFVFDRFTRSDAPVVEAEPPRIDDVEPSPPTSDSRQSLAVLPFANRSNREEDRFFTDGIHDDLLSHLSKIGALKVISRTSVMRYRNTDKSIPEIADELGVTNVLEGGVQRSGDQVRINVQLIDAGSDEHLWAQIFDRELNATNLFAIQSEISQAIADALRAELTDEEKSRLSHVPTDNLDAYQAYLQGRDQFQRRLQGGSDALFRAIDHFKHALALEPDYADACAGLAATYVVLNGYLAEPDPTHLEQSRHWADQALALNPDLAEPHAVLGLFYTGPTERDVVRGEQRLRRAIELEPSNFNARLWLGIVYAVAGHLDRAHEQFRAARELNPTSAITAAWVALSHELRGELEEAVRVVEALGKLGSSASDMWLAHLKLRQDKVEAAIDHLRAHLPEDRAEAWIQTVVPAYRDPSLKDAATRIILADAALLPNTGNVIACLTGIGAVKPALDVLESRLDAEGDLVVWGWRRDSNEIRTSPRFKALVKDLNLPAYWRVRGWPEFCHPVGDNDFECI